MRKGPLQGQLDALRARILVLEDIFLGLPQKKVKKPRPIPKVEEETGFEEVSLKKVIESALYTSEEMFGDIRFGAQQELERRFPPPKWARKK